jgi:hypothetical protein
MKDELGWIAILLAGSVFAPCLCASEPATTESTMEWKDPHFDHRIQLHFDHQVEGQIEIDLEVPKIFAALEKLVAEPVDLRSFNFEACRVVDPETGETIGSFRLVLEGKNLVANSDYQVSQGKMDRWTGFLENGMTPERIDVNGMTKPLLKVSNPDGKPMVLSQSIPLELGALYVMDWMAISDTGAEGVTVDLWDPAKKLYGDHMKSYSPMLLPIDTWRRNLVLFDATIPEAILRISSHGKGQGAVTAINFRNAVWRLLADVKKPTKSLDVYLAGRAGHRLTTVTPELLEETKTERTKKAPAQFKVQARDANPTGYLETRPGLTVWSVPPEAPLRSDHLRQWLPSEARASKSAEVVLPRGGSYSLLLVMDSGTPHLNISNFTAEGCTLAWKVERVAPLDVFDGEFSVGKKTQVRFDPKMALDDPVLPASPDGIHILCVTFHAGPEAKPGTSRVVLKMQVANPVPQSMELEVPVDLTVLSPVIKPFRHFSAMFGNELLMLKYPKGDPFPREQIAMAEFHGFKNENGEWDEVAMNASVPQINRPEREPVRKLAQKYNEALLDHYVMPSVPQYEATFGYQIERDETGKITLTNFQFSAFNDALQAQVIERDAPWFTLVHTNGFLMDRLFLNDGKYYSLLPAPAGREKEWVQLDREEYYGLVGQYFEALAKNLKELGVLDRAIIIVDESDVSTYETIQDYVQTLKEQPTAKEISFGHTTYHGTFYSTRAGDQFLMDELIDIPIPINDEHFNFFEPEYSSRFRDREPLRNWVYYVSTDHWDLDHAGLSTVLTPLKLGHFGKDGWYCWASMAWSLPYAHPKPEDYIWDGSGGALVNPWLNPYYHHGPGVASFFYPPDPAGIPAEFTDKIVPSYRLDLMREGIELRAFLEVLEKGVDDNGEPVAVDPIRLAEARKELNRLWYDNPVQWQVSYGGYRRARELLNEALLP